MGFYEGAIIIALCLIVNSASAAYTEDEIMEARSYCHNITSTNEQETSEAMESDIPAEIERKIKCYWQCYLKEIEWMDSNGEIHEKPNISPVPCWVKYASVCLDATGDDVCDKAIHFMQCFFKNTRKEQATDKSCH